jgi:hypothetical protein
MTLLEKVFVTVVAVGIVVLALLIWVTFLQRPAHARTVLYPETGVNIVTSCPPATIYYNSDLIEGAANIGWGDRFTVLQQWKVEK